MVLDLTLVFVLIVSTVRGYQKGLASKLIGVAGILTAYVASMFLYRPLGDVLRDTYGLPPLIAYGGGGMAVFGIVTLLFALADMIRRGIMERHMVTLTALDRSLGALLGFATGSVYALLVLLLAFLLPPNSAIANMLQTSESVLLSQARPITDGITARVGGLVMGDSDLGKALSHTLASPVTVSKKVQAMLASPRTGAVVVDHELMERVRRGNLDAVMQDGRVKDLFADPAAKELLREFSTDGKSQQANKAVILKMLSMIERVRSTPWAQEIVADPEIQVQLKKGDIVGLMKNQKLGHLLTGDTAVAEDRPQ